MSTRRRVTKPRIACAVRPHRFIPAKTRCAALVLAVFALSSCPSSAQTSAAPGQPLRLSFVPHAAFFSLRTKQRDLVDPEVFVSEPGAPPATAYEQIAHAAGIRNALMRDDGTQAARDANGRKLGVDLQQWFTATGLVAFSPSQTPGGGVTMAAHFATLVPRGRYSLFRLKNGAPQPLDGSGAENSFTAGADGVADVSLTLPRMPSHGELVILLFHSDGRDHGLQTGAEGIDAEPQLVLQLP